MKLLSWERNHFVFGLGFDRTEKTSVELRESLFRLGGLATEW